VAFDSINLDDQPQLAGACRGRSKNSSNSLANQISDDTTMASAAKYGRQPIYVAEGKASLSAGGYQINADLVGIAT
jgi:hypothetical protein